MPIQFKYEHDKKRALFMNPIAIMIMVEMALWSNSRGLPFVVTQTYTTKAEDDRVNRKHRTHREGRAFDVSIRGWSQDDLDQLKDYTTKKHGVHAAVSSKTLKKALIVQHTGTAAHLHVQIHPRYTQPKGYLIVE